MWDAKQLKEKREADGLSAEKLANILGTTKENIYKRESGTKPMQNGMYKKVEEYLNGVKPQPKKILLSETNGTIKDYINQDYKEKYFVLLEKYTALLEQTKP